MEYLLSESYHFLLYNQGVCHHHGQIEMDSRSVLGFAGTLAQKLLHS